MYGENLLLTHFVGKKKKPKWDTKNVDVIQRAIKIDKRKETKRQTKKGPSRILVRLDHKPCKIQLKNKLVKNKMNNKG
jgi:hypothetical protein